MGLAASEAPPELDVILGWADTVRRGRNPARARLNVRANADTGVDAARAPARSAEGIGLLSAPSTCSWATIACRSSGR